MSENALIDAARRGDADAVRAHINLLYGRDENGWTALMHAVKGGYFGCAKYLLDESKCENRAGETAADIAELELAVQTDLAVRARYAKCLRLLQITPVPSPTASPSSQPSPFTIPSRNTGETIGYPSLDARFIIRKILSRSHVSTTFCVSSMAGKDFVIKKLHYSGIRPELIKAIDIQKRLLPELQTKEIIEYLEIIDDKPGYTIFFVMPYYQNTLKQEIHKRRAAKESFSDKEVQMIIRDVSGALMTLHSKGIIHRNVQTKNILLNKDGRCVLSGLSYCVSLDDEWPTLPSPCAALERAPEIVVCRPYDARVDIWSLGVIAYELCTFRYPFESQTDLILHPPSPIEGRSEEVCTLVNSLLEKDILSRPDANTIYIAAEE
ncbi:Kinase, NEK [Giardia muris]|uniref:Kinase, NEK n=1 Tax=Giardia muris TaxID=5742 RepID=A0A4Z1SQR9_GIAMU|nr:Kinase, NEK [Giardia muris]|eukprot:TNJ28186.1 Kinase, NEK [Giardia muris]